MTPLEGWLNFGITIALADGTITDEESLSISDFAEDATGMSAAQVQRHVNAHRRGDGPSLKAISAAIEGTDQAQALGFLKLCYTIASADDDEHPKEEEMLRHIAAAVFGAAAADTVLRYLHLTGQADRIAEQLLA